MLVSLVATNSQVFQSPLSPAQLFVSFFLLNIFFCLYPLSFKTIENIQARARLMDRLRGSVGRVVSVSGGGGGQEHSDRDHVQQVSRGQQLRCTGCSHHGDLDIAQKDGHGIARQQEHVDGKQETHDDHCQNIQRAANTIQCPSIEAYPDKGELKQCEVIRKSNFGIAVVEI